MKGHMIHPRHIHEKASHMMKGRKAGGPVKGDDDEAEDMRMKEKKTNDVDDVEEEAEAKKAKKGGRIKKHVGKVKGEEHKHHAGRAKRKSGGACESDPFTTAHHVTPARGRKLEKETED